MPRPARRLCARSVGLFIVMMSASCAYLPVQSAHEPTTVQSTSSVPEALALVREPTATGTNSILTTSTTAAAGAVEEVAEAARVDGESAAPPNTATPSTASPKPVVTASPDAGSPSQGTQASADLMSQYYGTIGRYSLNQVLATAPAPAPTPIQGAAPLTGIPGATSGPAVVVKIDNSNRAMPQSGLNLADVIIEEEVEWGITRLAAIFQSQHAVVGPIRSGRTTDISFLGSLANPALVYSGANKIIDTLLLRQDYVQNFSAARNSAYWRDSSRRAPSNLFADSASFTDHGSPPPPWFAYRSANQASVGTPVTEVSLTLGATAVRWVWSDGSWWREQNGAAHRTDDNQQVHAVNIVVATVARIDTGMVDSAGGTVPEFIWAGTGAVSVFSDGTRVDGTWTRATLQDPAILVDDAGVVIELTPGRTWVELVAD